MRWWCVTINCVTAKFLFVVHLNSGLEYTLDQEQIPGENDLSITQTQFTCEWQPNRARTIVFIHAWNVCEHWNWQTKRKRNCCLVYLSFNLKIHLASISATNSVRAQARWLCVAMQTHCCTQPFRSIQSLWNWKHVIWTIDPRCTFKRCTCQSWLCTHTLLREMSHAIVSLLPLSLCRVRARAQLHNILQV